VYLPGVHDRQTHGLTRSVGSPSVRSVGWNEHPLLPAVVLPLPTPRILLPSRCRTAHPPSPSLPLRKRLGTISDAHTVNFGDRNAPNSGPAELSLTNLTHGNYGGQLTFYSVVAACQLILPSMSNRLTVSLLRRSLRCSPAPAAHLHQYYFRRARSDVTFLAFSPLATDDVINAVRRLSDKFSAADSIPTSIFKQIIDVIVPFVVALFNRSLAAGHFLAGFKEAFLTPIVKKPRLDLTEVRSYRPISNLSVLSKLYSNASLLAS